MINILMYNSNYEYYSLIENKSLFIIKIYKINMKKKFFNVNNHRNMYNNNCSSKGIITVVTYANADANKFIICKENINKSGVYRWVNKINGINYISSSISLNNRLIIYYYLNSLTLKIKGSRIIYRALLKYGHAKFSLDILEYCEPNVLINRERYYINLLKPEYNILKM
jgi:hypothetical protein